MRQILFFTVLLLSIYSVNAQVVFGVKGGLNVANAKIGGGGGSTMIPSVKVNLEIDTESITSFYVGGFAEFTLNNEKSKIQTELLYSRMGAMIKESTLIPEATFKLSQLTIPIIGKYEIYENLNLYGGLYFGFNIDLTEEYEDDISSVEDFKSSDVGLIVGAEYNFSNGLFVETRYNYGLKNLLDISESIDIQGHTTAKAEVTYKNRTFQFGVGYKF